MEPATGQFRATMSAASSFHVYPLRAQAAEAGTLKMGKTSWKYRSLQSGEKKHGRVRNQVGR